MRRILTMILLLTLLCGCLALPAEAAGETTDAVQGAEAADPDGGEARYRLVEEEFLTDIGMEPVPLAAAPRDCCSMHFVLMLGALAVAVYFTHDRKTRQVRIYELRKANAE